MPSIENSLIEKIGAGLHMVEPPGIRSPQEEPIPTRNKFLRCPMPPLAPISVDNLDQFDLRGLVPQYRVLLGGK